MPSKTVSFVAREELVEWLEEKADHQMTTVSSTVQQILAEKYREDQESADASEEDSSEDQQEMEESGADAPDDPLERWDEHWYRPDSDTNEYAVRRPEGRALYHQSADGARNALQRVYGDS